MHDDNKGFFEKVFTIGTKECGIACAFVGILTALMLLYAGVWITLLVFGLAGLGLFLGGAKNKRKLFNDFFDLFGGKK